MGGRLQVITAGWTQLHIRAEELLGLALQRALHVGDGAVKIEGDSQGHCFNTLTFFPFVPGRKPPLSQIHALRLVRSLEPGLGDMSSGAWRLLGLACTLAALFLVN